MMPRQQKKQEAGNRKLARPASLAERGGAVVGGRVAGNTHA